VIYWLGMIDWGLLVGIGGVGYGIWSDLNRRRERDWVHMALVNLKPSIQGGNAERVIKAIDQKEDRPETSTPKAVANPPRIRA
jgi:hypothetical protein